MLILHLGYHSWGNCFKSQNVPQFHRSDAGSGSSLVNFFQKKLSFHQLGGPSSLWMCLSYIPFDYERCVVFKCSAINTLMLWILFYLDRTEILCNVTAHSSVQSVWRINKHGESCSQPTGGNLSLNVSSPGPRPWTVNIEPNACS